MTQLYDPNKTYTCTKCGQDIPGVTLYKRQTRGNDSTQCTDCNATPVKYISKTRCIPWHGDFDMDTQQPLKNGQPHMVGLRTCGNADCVNKKHFVPMSQESQNLIAEQFSVAYRTGIMRSYDELVADLKREKGKVNV